MGLRWVALLVTFIVFCIALAPLSLVAGPLLERAPGLSVVRASGTIWSGTLTTVSLGGIALGDMKLSLDPLSLLQGTVRMNVSASGPVRSFRVGVDGQGALVENVTVATDLSGLLANVPQGLILRVNGGAGRFTSTGCLEASGEFRLEDDGSRLPGAVRGPIACLNGVIVADAGLEGSQARAQLSFRMGPGGEPSISAETDDPTLKALFSSLVP